MAFIRRCAKACREFGVLIFSYVDPSEISMKTIFNHLKLWVITNQSRWKLINFKVEITRWNRLALTFHDFSNVERMHTHLYSFSTYTMLAAVMVSYLRDVVAKCDSTFSQGNEHIKFYEKQNEQISILYTIRSA